MSAASMAQSGWHPARATAAQAARIERNGHLHRGYPDRILPLPSRPSCGIGSKMNPPSTPVFRAVGFGGLELPVLDVTNPAFAAVTPERMAELQAEFLRDEERRRRV